MIPMKCRCAGHFFGEDWLRGSTVKVLFQISYTVLERGKIIYHQIYYFWIFWAKFITNSYYSGT